MSRKIRVVKGQIAALPSPAWTFALLVGADPGARLHGWVQQAQAGIFGEPTAAGVWNAHTDALSDEARRHGFEPYWADEPPPER